MNRKTNNGGWTHNQVRALRMMLDRGRRDPSQLCDLEGSGPVGRLERAFADHCRRRYALAVSSGTAALHTALMACGIGQGDEVIVTPYSWPQSVAPVLHAGATPVFADIDPASLNMDADSVAERLSNRTRAILPVHLYGRPVDMERLTSTAVSNGCRLVVDAAHALGAGIDGLPIGAFGDVACFSFSRGKLICGGEGGMLVTDDEEIYREALAVSQHPERSRRAFGPSASCSGLGFNYRMHPVAAALALAGMKDMDRRSTHRQAIFETIAGKLEKIDALRLPSDRGRTVAARYGFPLIARGAIDRRNLVEGAWSAGVPLRCGPVGLPLHTRVGPAAVKDQMHATHRSGACPQAEIHCADRELWLLGAVDMDRLDVEEAEIIGEKLCDIALSLLESRK